jgi:hypothetical protein
MGALIKRFNWEIFDHPPNSPDLAPSSYDSAKKFVPLFPVALKKRQG